MKRKFIKSSDNKLVKLLKKLREKPNQNYFIVEKSRDISCFLEAGFKLKNLISSEDQSEDPVLNDNLGDFTIEVLEKSLYRTVNQMQSLPDLLAVFEQKESLLKAGNFKKKDFLIIDQVQDPGNLGTIFRTALASGWEKIICLKGTVEPFTPKVIRASAGLLAYLELYSQVSFQEVKTLFNDLKDQNLRIYNSSPHLENNYQREEFQEESLNCLIIGNEGQGTSTNWDLLSKEDKLEIKKIQIPMLNQNKVESLNAAISGALLMYKLHNLI